MPHGLPAFGLLPLAAALLTAAPVTIHGPVGVAYPDFSNAGVPGGTPQGQHRRVHPRVRRNTRGRHRRRRLAAGLLHHSDRGFKSPLDYESNLN